MRHRIEIAEPLHRAQALRKQRVLCSHDLNHAACPADPLLYVAAEPLRGKTGRLRDINVGGVPPTDLHPQTGMGVFGHRLHGDAADLIQCGPPEDRTRPAEESRIPEVVSILHDAVEQLPLIRNGPELAEVSLKRVWGVEVVRRLQHAKVRVAKKPAHRDLQKGTGRHVIGVEDRNQW